MKQPNDDSKGSSMMDSKKQLIEEINILGPWVHGYFDLGNGIIIEDSDSLQKSRLFAILETLKGIISHHFTRDDTKNLTLSDIGCNTGYFLVELHKEFGFKTLFGYEPKLTNLEKAKFIRNQLEIDESSWFLSEYDLLKPPTNIISADITMCIGVLHHVDDIYTACRHLFEQTKDLIILECMVLPEVLNNDDLKQSLELKDIIYSDETFEGKKIPFGMMGLKHESHFYDGAAAKSGIVSVPTASALCMILESVGFIDVKINRSETDFHESHYSQSSYRKMNSAVITAKKINSTENHRYKNIAQSTHNMQKKEMNVLLPTKIMSMLHSDHNVNDGIDKKLVSIIRKFKTNQHTDENDLAYLKKEFATDQFNIVMGFRFQYESKVALEYAKCLVQDEQLDEATVLLERLIFTLNLDWRVCYRSYYLLAKIMFKKNQLTLAELNINKCLRAYKHFFPASELLKKIAEAKL